MFLNGCRDCSLTLLISFSLSRQMLQMGERLLGEFGSQWGSRAEVVACSLDEDRRIPFEFLSQVWKEGNKKEREGESMIEKQTQ